MRKPTALKRAFFDSGQTQKDVAGRLGMDPATLSRIVNGLHCDDRTRGRIACALGRDVSDLWPDETDLSEAA